MTAEARIAVEEGILDVVAVVDIDPDGASHLDIGLATEGETKGFTVASVRMDSAMLDVTPRDDRLRVALGEASESTVRLELRYRGAPGDTGDFVTKNEIMLRGEAGWLPTMSSSSAHYEVTIIHDSNFQLFGQGVPATPQSTGAGQTRARWQHRGESFTLYGAPEYRTQAKKIGDTEVIVAAWPRDEAQLSTIMAQAEEALVAMSVLGPYPLPRLQIVEGGLAGGYGGYGAVSNISLGWRTFEEGGDLTFLAHEIAHGWFGGVVPAMEQGAGGWPESMAEYVASWALPDALRDALRTEWSEGYAALDASMDVALLDVTWDHGWEVYEAVAYKKGALVLTRLEERIGRDAMVGCMRAFIDTRRDQPSQWSDFVAVVRDLHGEALGDAFESELTQTKRE